MSVCTLPTPASPRILGWCPQVNIVLFVSETHLILCRRSGQQVWSTRLPSPSSGASPVAVSWGPDGQLFALIFSDGVYTLHQVSNGRQPMSFRPEPTKVVSIAWAISEEPRSSSLEMHQRARAGPENFSRTSIAAIGTEDGKLKISIYGALSIGDIELNTDCKMPVSHVLADESAREYAAVQNFCLYVYRMADRADHQPIAESKRLHEVMAELGYTAGSQIETARSHRAARQSARAVELSTSLVQSCSKYVAVLEEAQKHHQAFFQAFTESKSVTAQESILAAGLYGILDATCVKWIQSQHEQGFKRWYKAVSQSFETMRKLLADEILVCIEDLLMVIGDLLGSGFDQLSEAHKLVFKLIADNVQGSQKFETEACFIEHLFRGETDRPIAVTKISKISLSSVIESLVQPGPLLGTPEPADGEQLVALVVSVQISLDRAVQKTRDLLKAQMRLCYAVDVGGTVSELKRNYRGGGYQIILESGNIVLVDRLGSVNVVDNMPRQGAVFTGHKDDVVSFKAQDKLLVLPDGTTKLLEIEPIAIATRFDGGKVQVCVLSEDCQHYQFLTI